MTDKPLHVQVAEALNVSPTPRRHDPCHPGYGWVPHYDTDWSATGPLIEQLGITVEAPTHRDPHWTAALYPMGIMASSEDGPTPLVAVCNLILALHKAGKL